MPVGMGRPMTWVDALLPFGIGSAFITGASSSLHCALMCGPLACAAVGPSPGRRTNIAGWHAGRLLGYSSIGAVLGAVGFGVVAPWADTLRSVLPWVFIAGLVATAFDFGRHAPAIPALRRILGLVTRQAARWPPPTRALALGAATPLLPCGLLYGLFLSALATGSALHGAAVMGAFSLGALPALLAAQAGLGLTRRLSPNAQRAIRVATPLAAAVVLAVRTLSTGGGAAVCH